MHRTIVLLRLSIALLAASSAIGCAAVPHGLGAPQVNHTAAERLAATNLYVANYYPNSSVTVYAPGGTSVLRSITNLPGRPTALAFDGSSNLYVANYQGARQADRGSVTIYAPGSTSVLRTITAGISGPIAIAFGP